MDWLHSFVLVGGLILLVLAVVFLLFAELVKRVHKAQVMESRKRAQQRVSDAVDNALGAEEVGAREKAALGLPSTQTSAQSHAPAEGSGKPDGARPV